MKKQLDHIQTLVGRLNTVAEVAQVIERFKQDQLKIPAFMWELGKLAKPTD